MTSDQPTPPIFVFADDLESFDSVEAVERYVEPWDVDGVVDAYDSLGQRLRLTAEGVVRTRRTVGEGTTSLHLDPSVDADPLALAASLREYVLRNDPSRYGLTEDEVRSAGLLDLIEAVHPLTIRT